MIKSLGYEHGLLEKRFQRGFPRGTEAELIISARHVLTPPLTDDPTGLCSLLPCTVLKAFSDSQVTELKTKVHLATCNPAYRCPSGALSSRCPCSLAVALQSLHLPGHYHELLLPSAIPAPPELKSSSPSIIIILSNRSLPE